MFVMFTLLSMNLPEFEIPDTFEEMQKAYTRFYRYFYLEMVRMSNSNFSTYVDNFINILTTLSKTPQVQNAARTAMGVLSLYNFGYPDFSKLSRIFDRVIPQVDTEYVLFTSWVAGKLIHHPNTEQSKYVQHLFERTLGWIRAHGRRSRHLAAAHMIESISANAGSDIVISYNQLQSAIWILVSHPSVQLIKATSQAIFMFVRATMRYGRGELHQSLDFFTVLCTRLLSLGSSFKVYSALKMIEVLIKSCPDYYIPYFNSLTKTTFEILGHTHLIVKCAAFTTLSYFPLIDHQQFLNNVIKKLISITDEILPEFPMDVAKAIARIIDTAPEAYKDKLDLLFSYINIMSVDKDAAFVLLTSIYKQYKNEMPENPLYDVFALLNSPLTENYKQFAIAYAPICGNQQFAQKICEVIQKALSEPDGPSAIFACDLIANLPNDVILDHEKLLCVITSNLQDRCDEFRCVVAQAIFHLTESCESLSSSIMKQLFQLAIFDPSPDVRMAILEVLASNAKHDMAGPDYVKYIIVVSSDDSSHVRKKAYCLLKALSKVNPMAIAPITRDAILEAMFTLQNVPSIRQKAKVVRTLPALVKASGGTMRIYAPTVIKISSDILIHPPDRSSLENFLEEHAVDEMIVGLLETLSLAAPFDPESIDENVEELITILCDHLKVSQNRSIILASLKLLYILLTPPTSSFNSRGMEPIILNACSKFLMETHSRKARMAVLKVIGAIGVLEIHQMPEPKTCDPPDIMDDELARQFFHPNRDRIGEIDDTLLMHPATTDQCIVAIVTSSLMQMFQDDSLEDFSPDTAAALVEVLKNPRMAVLAYFDSFVSRLLDLIERADDILAETYIKLLTSLVEATVQNTGPFLPRTLKILMARFSDYLTLPILELLTALAVGMRDLFVHHAAEMICKLDQMLATNKCTNEKPCLLILNIFAVICMYAGDLLYLIIPTITDILVCDQSIHSVVVESLKTLEKMVRSTDLFRHIGAICRAIEAILKKKDDDYITAAISLVNALIISQGREFLMNADPLLDYIRSNNLETDELRNTIKSSVGQAAVGIAPTSRVVSRKPVVKAKAANNHVFSEESILVRILSPALGGGRHLEQWLYSLVLAVINGSPSDSIRACAVLASNYRPLSIALFKIAFYTCWKLISEEGRKAISDTFMSILIASENYETVAQQLLDLIFFMHKMTPPMEIPSKDIVRVCLRYGRDAFALFLQQSEFFVENVRPKSVQQLIDVYVQLGQWDNAHAIWKILSDRMPSIRQPDSLAKLKMWDKAYPGYKKVHERGDTSAFIGLVKSLASMAMWPEMMEYLDEFKSLGLATKRNTTSLFANAMIHLGRWEDLNSTLQSAPEDSLRCLALSALNQLHRGEFEKVNETIDNAFSLLASRPIMLWAENMTIHKDTMLVAQQLVEINEIKNWLQDEERRHEIEFVWNERLKMAPRDFEIWFKILGNRASITGVRDDSYITFFGLRSVTIGTKMHMHAFNALFPNFDFETSPPLASVCYAVVHWNTGDRERALLEMKILTKSVEGDLLDRCRILYASWLLETGDTPAKIKDAYENLQQLPAVTACLAGELRPTGRKISNASALFFSKAVVNQMKEDNTNVTVLRLWSDVNMQLIKSDPLNIPQYVTNAIDALSHCCTINPSFTDVIQLLNLFFTHANEGNVFELSANGYLSRLSPKLLLQASPQILVQLSHPTPEVAQFVHDTVLDLLKEHYHELIFSVIVMKFSKDHSRAMAACGLINEFSEMNPSAAEEVLDFRKCMLRAAVTWYEKVMQRITDAFDRYSMQQFDEMVETLRSIADMAKHPKCQMHDQFLKQYGPNMAALERILKVFSPLNQNAMGQLTQWCKTMQTLLTEDIKKTRIIQLSSLSHSIAEKNHFQLAVPGTYKPGKPIIRIQYVVGQFSVYMSKQQPKDVVMRGEDGKFYQYLVKGHEDLRLDERIQQFFRLINSFLKREMEFSSHLIQTTSVVPLSVQHGLVQWVPGTDTLRVVVEQYRRLKMRDPIQEYTLTEKLSFGSYDYLMPIQKMQIMKQVMSVVPDTDIASTFYLKAPDAETWMKQTTTFSISTGITSIVGYTIGLGDRHPSNLLIDRNTGKIVHIDFGDCFERAAKRKFLPEVVPFRLTRMMVRAMGVTGAEGSFRTAFVNTSRVLREHRRVLIMVLELFVHEPLVDPHERRSGSANNKTDDTRSFVDILNVTGSVIDKGRVLLMDPQNKQSNTEMRSRVNQKLSGTDFEESEPLSVEDQATLLIKQATDPYSLAKMYSGWCPFW